MQKAVALDPNNASNAIMQANEFVKAGEIEQAMAVGREEEGRQQVCEALKITRKDFSLAAWNGEFWNQAARMNAAPDPCAGQCVVDRARRVMFMLKAGLPE